MLPIMWNAWNLQWRYAIFWGKDLKEFLFLKNDKWLNLFFIYFFQNRALKLMKIFIKDPEKFYFYLKYLKYPKMYDIGWILYVVC